MTTPTKYPRTIRLSALWLAAFFGVAALGVRSASASEPEVPILTTQDVSSADDDRAEVPSEEDSSDTSMTTDLLPMFFDPDVIFGSPEPFEPTPGSGIYIPPIDWDRERERSTIFSPPQRTILDRIFSPIVLPPTPAPVRDEPDDSGFRPGGNWMADSYIWLINPIRIW